MEDILVRSVEFIKCLASAGKTPSCQKMVEHDYYYINVIF